MRSHWESVCLGKSFCSHYCRMRWCREKIHRLNHWNVQCKCKTQKWKGQNNFWVFPKSQLRRESCFCSGLFPPSLNLKPYVCSSQTLLLPSQTLILQPIDKKIEKKKKVEFCCGAALEWLQFLCLQGNVRNLLVIKEMKEQLFSPSDVMDQIKVFHYYRHSKVYG